MFNAESAYTAAVENEELNYPNLSYIEETGAIHLDSTAPPHDYSKDYFTIVSLEDNNDITWNRSTTLLYITNVSASTDGGQTWVEKSVGGTSNSLATLNTGDKLLIKSTLSPNSSDGIGRIAATKQFTVEGNSMSLLFGDNFTGQTSLDNKGYCYQSMFNGCSGLTSAENLILPATTLNIYCYYNMFSDCTSLTKPPKLPATALKNYCYYQMFYGCTSLTTAPKLPATTLTGFCYGPMFSGCTSLTTAPDLPATRLEECCYTYMFKDCSSLNYIKCLATDVSARNCLIDWVNGVAATGTFVKAQGATIPAGTSGIPNGWTVQEV